MLTVAAAIDFRSPNRSGCVAGLLYSHAFPLTITAHLLVGSYAGWVIGDTVGA